MQNELARLKRECLFTWGLRERRHFSNYDALIRQVQFLILILWAFWGRQ